LFACAWWCGGLNGEKQLGEFDQNIPHGGSIKIFYFSFGNEPLWLVHHHPLKKKKTPSLW
jgi:hypothetical protein